jgi:hypothetical protein
VIQNINGALQAVGCALLVLFFVMGVVKTCGSFTELRKPEMALKCFIRFVLAQAAVTHGMELMTALFRIAQGMVSTIMSSSGLTAASATSLPSEMEEVIQSVGFLESIPLWAITLLGSLFIWVLSLVMILTVYSRFFKLYMATAIAPIPLSSFAGQPSSSIGVAFIKSYAAICLRQFVFALLAVAVAVGVYFCLHTVVGSEIGWLCVLAAFPFAMCGFFRYNGMTFERFLLALIRSELLYPRQLIFKGENLYGKLMEHSSIKEALRLD